HLRAEAARVPRAPRGIRGRAAEARAAPRGAHPVECLLRADDGRGPPHASRRRRPAPVEPARGGPPSRQARGALVPVGGPALTRRAVLALAVPAHPHGGPPDRIEDRDGRLERRLLPPVHARQALLPGALGPPGRPVAPAHAA